MEEKFKQNVIVILLLAIIVMLVANISYTAYLHNKINSNQNTSRFQHLGELWFYDKETKRVIQPVGNRNNGKFEVFGTLPEK